MLATRKSYLDIVKVIAIILVIFNHTGAEGYRSFLISGAVGVVSVKMAISTFCKINVMLFFMCSGALLIPKRESIKDTLKKRVLKFALILLAVSFIYFLYMVFVKGQAFDLPGFFRYIYSHYDYSMCTEYWYLYWYLMFLLILPIIRAVCNNLKREHIRYILALFLIFNCALPIIERTFNLEPSVINVTWITNFIFVYPTLGYYFDSEEYSESRRSRIVIGLLAAFSIVYTVIRCTIAINDGTYVDDMLSEMVVFTTIFVFIMCKRIRLNDVAKKIFMELGACTFGIYLFHGYVLKASEKILIKGGYGTAWVRVAVVFAVTLVIVMGLRRLPGVRKVL